VKGVVVSSSMELIEDMERKRATWRRGLSLRCLTISLIDLWNHSVVIGLFLF
jgi:hypothetical protein